MEVSSTIYGLKEAGKLSQELLGVTAGPEGCIDQHRAGPIGRAGA
jgi:hypothetical protein